MDKKRLLNILISSLVGIVLSLVWLFDHKLLLNNFLEIAKKISFFKNKEILVFFIVLTIFNLFIIALITLLQKEVKVISDLKINWTISVIVISILILIYGIIVNSSARYLDFYLFYIISSISIILFYYLEKIIYKNERVGKIINWLILAIYFICFLLLKI